MDDKALETEATTLAKKILLSGERSGVYPTNLKACSSLIMLLIKQDREAEYQRGRQDYALEVVKQIHDALTPTNSETES